MNSAALLLAAALAAGEAPQVGQAGKDVGWVPTPERLVRRMLQLADTTPQDVVLDLGAGDGRIPIYAAKHFGARGIGVELEANLIQAANQAAAAQGVAQRVRFIQQDLFKADLSAATVVALYVSPAVMEQLRPKLLALKPGTRIVSHHFTLSGWPADEEVEVEGRRGYLWVVPAKVAGEWTVTLPGEEFRLKIGQRYQMVDLFGAIRNGRPVIAARLRGTDISFTAFDREGSSQQFVGQVEGERMIGAGWSATRQKR